MQRYVVGFLFDNLGYVALIHKNRPAWQRGRLNGVGGHIEEGETPEEAMHREFQEEAGLSGLPWRKFGVVLGSEYELHLFSAKANAPAVVSKTDERVDWCLIRDLPENILPNLAWMVPMANYHLPIMAEIVHDSPEC